MILNKNIDVKVYSKNTNYYKNLGYKNIRNNDIINIPTCELSKGSHILVDVQCDICGKMKKIEYQKYIKNIDRQSYYTCSQKCGNNKRKITNLRKYDAEFPLQNKEIRKNVNKTNMNKYGVINPYQSEECKEKIRKTCLEKYGFIFAMQNEDIKNKSLQNRFFKIVKNDEFFQVYKNEVRKLTNRNRKSLFQNWSGYDFYDNEYIKDFSSYDCNDPNYPTLDHKIPITYGFLNNINPEKISEINNLCITKRRINSSKNNKLNFTYIS